MNDEAIAEELQRQREPARRCFEHYARQEQLGILLPAPKPGLEEIAASLAALVTQHPKFGQPQTRFYGEKQLMLHPQFLPRSLLQVAVWRDGLTAVSWLHKVYDTESTDLRFVAAVHGLEITQPIALENGVTIVPLTSVLNSPNAHMLARQFEIRPGFLSVNGFSPTPNAAVLEIRGVAASLDYAPAKPATDFAYDVVGNSIKAFTLADGGAPVVGISWLDFSDPDLTAADVARIWMGARFEGALNRVPTLKVDDAALEWVDRYLHLDEEVRAWIDVAIDRLNLARRRTAPGDKAIEGRSALKRCWAMMIRRN